MLIQQLARGGFALNLFAAIGQAVTQIAQAIHTISVPSNAQTVGSGANMQRLRRALRIRFPLILDEYVIGSFLQKLPSGARHPGRALSYLHLL
jgi:hypothetical protein